VARDLSRWSQDHVRHLAEAGKRYGVDLDAEPRGEKDLMKRVRERTSEFLGREPEASLLVLLDLREIYMRASGVSVDWELLAQAAQGVKDSDLLAVAKDCHPEALRQVRWAHGKLKEPATQILVS
jgi:hypothetical protein